MNSDRYNKGSHIAAYRKVLAREGECQRVAVLVAEAA